MQDVCQEMISARKIFYGGGILPEEIHDFMPGTFSMAQYGETLITDHPGSCLPDEIHFIHASFRKLIRTFDK